MFRKWQLILKIIAIFMCTYSLSNFTMLAVEASEQEILSAEILGAKRLSSEISFGTLDEKNIIAWLLQEPVSYSDQLSIDELAPKHLIFKKDKISDDIIQEGQYLWKNSEQILSLSNEEITVLLLHREAWRFYGLGDLDKARLTYEKIPTNGRSFWIHYRLGELWALTETEKSNNYYKKAYQVATVTEKNPPFLFKVATIMYLDEEYENSIAVYTEVLGLQKDFVTYLYRGNAYFIIGELSQAINDYSMGIELNSDYGDLYINRARVYADAKQNENAIKDYQKYLSLKPSDQEAWQELIKFLLAQNRYADAKKEADRWVTVEKNQPNAWNVKGALSYSQKNYNEALADFKMVTQIDPAFHSAWYYQALSYEKIGFPEEWPIEKKWERLNLIKNCYGKFLQYSNSTHPDRARAEMRIEEINKYSGQILDI